MSKKIKVWIDKDERYPDYTLDKAQKDWGRAIEIDTTLYRKFIKAQSEYSKLSNEVGDIYNGIEKV